MPLHTVTLGASSLSGHCLVGEETVTVQAEGGLPRELPFSVLFAEQATQCPLRCFQGGGGTDVVYKPLLHALTLDTEHHRATWKPVRYLFRRSFTGRLIRIVTGDDRSLTVTDRHPMLVVENGDIRVRPAAAVRVDDRLPLSWGEVVATIPVRDLDTRDDTATVYSMEVEETHTFAASFGLYVHNCIPFDSL